MDLSALNFVLIPVRYAGVISEQKNSALWHILGEQLSWPKDAVLGPRFGHIAPKPMEKDKASYLRQNFTVMGDWRPTRLLLQLLHHEL
jgi:hypothetical protein